MLAKPQQKGVLRVCPKLLCLYYSPSVKATTIPMNVPFAEADLVSHKCARTRGRISSTFTRKMGLLWTCVHSFCLLRLLGMYAARKDLKNQMLLATRKLCTAIKRVQSNLVLTIVPESPNKLIPRNTARGCTPEFPATQSKKHIEVPRTQ